MKYKNLIELAQAFRSGELKDYILVLDNDDSFLRWIGKNPYEEDSDEYWDHDEQQHVIARTLFRGNGQKDLAEACYAAGIPNEPC